MVRGWVIGFVGAEGPVRHAHVQDGNGDRDEVEKGPAAPVGDEAGGHEGPDGAADAVAAVEKTERGRVVCEVRAKGVVESEVDGLTQPCEEEGEDDDGKGGFADEHDEADHHARLRQHQSSPSTQAGEERLRGRRGADEADGVGDEDEGDDGVADRVRFLHVGDQSPGSAVVEAVAEAHHAGAQEAPFVHGRVGERLHNLDGFIHYRAWWPAQLELVGGDWGLGSARCEWNGRPIVAVAKGQFVELIDTWGMVSYLIVLLKGHWRTCDGRIALNGKEGMERS